MEKEQPSQARHHSRIRQRVLHNCHPTMRDDLSLCPANPVHRHTKVRDRNLALRRQVLHNHMVQPVRCNEVRHSQRLPVFP